MRWQQVPPRGLGDQSRGIEPERTPVGMVGGRLANLGLNERDHLVGRFRDPEVRRASARLHAEVSIMGAAKSKTKARKKATPRRVPKKSNRVEPGRATKKLASKKVPSKKVAERPGDSACGGSDRRRYDHRGQGNRLANRLLLKLDQVGRPGGTAFQGRGCARHSRGLLPRGAARPSSTSTFLGVDTVLLGYLQTPDVQL